MDLRRGDLIEVQWADIFEDSVGNPEKAEMATRVSIGYFWCQKVSHSIPCLVTTTTIDGDTSGQNGYCIYPIAVVIRIRMIRRGKGKVYREQPSFTWAELESLGGKGDGLNRTGDAGKRSRTPKVRGTRHSAIDVQEVPEVCGSETPAAVE